MVDAAAIPENIKQDISIYLAPDERVLKAVNSISGKSSAGEVWLILTGQSIFFHTREPSKDAVVALVARNRLKEIDYHQKPTEIVLTFIPSSNPNNTTRLSFPISKKAEIEDICEDLADLINFRMETSAGVKVYPKPEETIAKKTEVKPASAGQASVRPTERGSEKPAEKLVNPEIKARAPIGSEVKIVSRTDQSSEGEPAPTRYIILATVISILVAFIWYQFFRTISGREKK
ncbi:MAG: hypothetical protein ACOYXC_16995 [Candidatus Rifleibacteriota bacterium]